MSNSRQRSKGIFGKLLNSISNSNDGTDNKSRITEISGPYNTVHKMHVGFDGVDYSGLPKEWLDLLHRDLTEADQKKNPKAVVTALKFYASAMQNNQDKFMMKAKSVCPSDDDVDIELDNKNDSSAGTSSSDNISVGDNHNIITKVEKTEDNVISETPPIPPARAKTIESSTIQKRVPPPLPPKPAHLKKSTPLSSTSSNSTLESLSNIPSENDISEQKQEQIITPPPRNLQHTKDNQQNDVVVVRQRQEENRTKLTDVQVLEELKKIVNVSNPYTKYKLEQKIGVGASGTVFTARILYGPEKGQIVAVKRMAFKSQPKKEMLLTEIKVMQKYQHPVCFFYI